LNTKGKIKYASVETHDRPGETRETFQQLLTEAQKAGIELYLSRAELDKHDLEPSQLVHEAELGSVEVDLCIALGGDGTVLKCLRTFAGRKVPVFAVNFGEIGFLSTVEIEGFTDGVRAAFAGELKLLSLPAISVKVNGQETVAANDVSIHRSPDRRVAKLAYGIEGEEVGRVRCDGLVASTPAGSTGYNLANGGPVLAWGVEGYVVSFIAPHSLTARALVVAPDDCLAVTNVSRGDHVELFIDGRRYADVAAGTTVEMRFTPDRSCLAQLPGSSFYGQLSEKFGRLAS